MRERERSWRCGGGGVGRQLSQLVEELVVMMEEQLSPLAVAHLLQHTLRSLCTQEGSQWVYAVFWRILPRNYPPPKWDLQGGAFDRSRGNRRNWILVWEDGFCNFAASAGGCAAGSSSSTGYGGCVDDSLHMIKGLQPELFFKMSHEIYSYGEGLIGKVAADHSHKWVFKEGAPADNNDANSLSAWQNPTDSQPRTWEAQFQCGIQTIALIAVREGVVQLGAVNKVVEDLSYVVLLRKRFSYLESIPGVLLPHPSSSSAFLYPLGGAAEDFHSAVAGPAPPTLQPAELYGAHGHPLIGQQVIRAAVTPSMSSLEALLSKLRPVGPLPPPSSLLPPAGYQQIAAAVSLWPAQSPGEVMGQLDRMEAKEEMDDIMYCVGSSEIRSMELGGQSGWYIQHAAKPTDGLI